MSATVAQKTGKVLHAIGSLAGTVGGIVGGEAGAIMIGAAAITTGAGDLLAKGASVQDVLSHMAAMPDVHLKWQPTIEDTVPATPSAKAAAKKDA